MKNKICSQCGYIGKEKMHVKGSLLIELALWLLMIVPGLIYSLWRLTTKRKGCPSCTGNMIDLDSPVGDRLYRQLRGAQ